MSDGRHSNRYPCLVPECQKLAQCFAKDNRAKHGHICLEHWADLPREERDHYEPPIA